MKSLNKMKHLNYSLIISDSRKLNKKKNIAMLNGIVAKLKAIKLKH